MKKKEEENILRKDKRKKKNDSLKKPLTRSIYFSYNALLCFGGRFCLLLYFVSIDIWCKEF